MPWGRPHPRFLIYAQVSGSLGWSGDRVDSVVSKGSRSGQGDMRDKAERGTVDWNEWMMNGMTQLRAAGARRTTRSV